MGRRRMLNCCECRAPAIAATGWSERDARRRVWFDGDEATCPKCGAELRIYVAEDYSDGQIAKVVTAARYAELRPEASP